jgi:DNA-binding NarL/FixJ family response regulator
MMRIRVVVAEDHVMVRQGLRALLERASIEVVGEAGDGREAVRLVEKLRPEVAVLDIALPLLNGIDAARAILKSEAGTKVVALTMHSERHYLVEAVRAGVTGYVLKSKAAEDLVQAIQEVARGAIYFGPEFSRDALRDFLARPDQPENPLTAREREVLQLVAEGKTNKEVASQLGISVKTAEAHRAHIMGKLNIHETAGLVRFAIREGIIRP